VHLLGRVGIYDTPDDVATFCGPLWLVSAVRVIVMIIIMYDCYIFHTGKTLESASRPTRQCMQHLWFWFRFWPGWEDTLQARDKEESVEDEVRARSGGNKPAAFVLIGKIRKHEMLGCICCLAG